MPDPAAFVPTMIEMENLGDEPEFTDFSSALEDGLNQVVVEMFGENNDDIERLKAEGGEEGIDRLVADAKIKALGRLVTPTLKAEVHGRLVQLTRRLRQEGQRQRADRIDALAQMLDWPAFPWTLFRPLTDAFDDTVERLVTHLMLHATVAEAVGVSPQTLSSEQMVELAEDPVVTQRLQELYEADKDLRDALDHQVDQLHAKLNHALFKGDLSLGLFTLEELALWTVLGERRLTESGIERDLDGLPQGGIEILADVLKETIRLLNTPARRARWQEHLTQMKREDPAGEMQALLSILQKILADLDDPEELQSWLSNAFVGEQRRLQARRATDEALARQFDAVYEQMLERLQQGEPLLPLTTDN
jgi:hypothetical protein